MGNALSRLGDTILGDAILGDAILGDVILGDTILGDTGSKSTPLLLFSLISLGCFSVETGVVVSPFS